MSKTVCVLGAGLSGLSTAYKLSLEGYNVHIFEKTDSVGGVSSTFKHKDYSLDYGPHKIYTQLPHIKNFILSLYGKDELLRIPKRSRIRLLGAYYDFPVGLKDVLLKMSPIVGLKCGLSAGTTILKSLVVKPKDKSYESYLVNRFGKGIYSVVFEDYARKVWGEPKTLSPELARTRVSIPNALALVSGVLFGNKNKPEVSADEFMYPKDGIIDLSKRILSKTIDKKGLIHYKTSVTKINTKNNKAVSIEYTENGKNKKLPVDFVVSSIPVSDLAGSIYPKNFELINSSLELKYRSLILLYLVFDKERLFKDNWLFFPEKEFIFNRLSEQKGFSQFMIPKNKTVLTVEITCDKSSDTWTMGKEQLLSRVLKDLDKSGIAKSEQVKDAFMTKLENVYPVYDLSFKEKLEKSLGKIESITNLYSIGRPGLFNYNNMDHCIDIGFITANFIISGKNKAEWKKTRLMFNNYRIVD